MSDLYCMCGKIGSGKTSYGYLLKDKFNSVIFNVDELMWPLFGDNLTREDFDKNLEICKKYIYKTAGEILNKNISVILDFGFWKRKERNRVKSLFVDHHVKFFYLKTDFDAQLKRIESRNKIAGAHYSFSRETVQKLNTLFEEPNQMEEDIELETIDNN